MFIINKSNILSHFLRILLDLLPLVRHHLIARLHLSLDHLQLNWGKREELCLLASRPPPCLHTAKADIQASSQCAEEQFSSCRERTGMNTCSLSPKSTKNTE